MPPRSAAKKSATPRGRCPGDAKSLSVGWSQQPSQIRHSPIDVYLSCKSIPLAEQPLQALQRKQRKEQKEQQKQRVITLKQARVDKAHRERLASEEKALQEKLKIVSARISRCPLFELWRYSNSDKAYNDLLQAAQARAKEESITDQDLYRLGSNLSPEVTLLLRFCFPVTN